MGNLFDRFLFLIRAEAKGSMKDLAPDLLKNLQERILRYSEMAGRLDSARIEKSFQEYLDKVRRFWEESSASHGKARDDSAESNAKWRNAAQEEFNKKNQTHDVSFPPVILKYYSALELAPGAGKEEIKKSWKKLMRKYHPDLFHTDPERRKLAAELSARLTQAYQELMAFVQNS